jgi:hypothetical protein
MSTNKLQKQFMDSIFTRDTKIHSHIKESSIPIDGRMRIYRNSTIGILSQTLKDSYPVLLQLVGDDFFEAMANHFIKQNKPSTGDITEYGWELPIFLQTFKPVQDYPYCIETAELELQRQKSYYAGQLPDIESNILKNMSEKEIAELKITLQPHVFLGSFKHTIFNIWLAHQQENIADIDISKPECTLTYRYNMDIFTKKISQEEFILLNTLQKSSSLQEAIDIKPDFNPQKIIQFLLKYKLLTK